MNKFHLLLLVGVSLFIGACSKPPAVAPTAEATLTPDPCSGSALGKSIKPINDLQREFDDTSTLAANLPREQLSATIANLQRIRRAAEDITPPACLHDLQTHQLAHMNTVIDTLIAFVGGADTTTLNAGMTQAQAAHDQYMLELARLIGATVQPTAAP